MRPLIYAIIVLAAAWALSSLPARGAEKNNNSQSVVINQCPDCAKSCQPKVITKWKTVYKDRIVEKPVIKYVEKIKIVEKPVVKIKYVDRPRIVYKEKVRVKRLVRKVPPRKNSLSLFGVSGKDKFEVVDTGTQVRVDRQTTYDVGLMYQRDWSRTSWSLGVTQDADVLFGLGINW